MNLSNRLTFSLIFSVLFIAAFAVVPIAMAAEGGPTATIAVDDSPIKGLDGNEDGDIDPTTDTGDSTATPPVPADVIYTDATKFIQVVDGMNVLMTNDTRTFIRSDGEGQFRVIVTFDQDVYEDTTETDQTAADGLDGGFVSGTAIDLTAYAVADGSAITGLTAAVARVDTVPDDGNADTTEDDGIQPHKRKFLVTITVPDAAGDLAPFVVRITIPVDAINSKASDQKLVNGVIQDAVEAKGSQEVSMDFTVIPKPLLKPTVTAPVEIRLDQRANVVLDFGDASDAPAEADQPTRARIMVTNGSILADDETTTDKDEGLFSNESGEEWTIILVPQGGIGLEYNMVVKATPGAPFELNKTIRVNSTPEDQRVDITTESTDEDRRGGAPFTVKIAYNQAPSSALTEAGVTVTGGTKVAGSFSGSGANYTIRVNPTDPAAGATGTLTVSVGEHSESFSILGSAVTTPTTVTSRVTSDVITIPANSFVVVVRDARAANAEANPPIVTPEGLAFRSGISKVAWSAHDAANAMPNLEEIFDRTAPGGGGALILEEDVATGGTGSAVGTVGISEIMWAIDEGYLGSAMETAQQWIELQNLTDEIVRVKLHSLTGQEITNAAKSKITGNLTAPILDAVTNFFNNRPGHVAWDVPGSNGDTRSGAHFVSMARILPHNKAAYADADGARFSNRDGRASGHWQTSSNVYLRKQVTVGDTQRVYEYRGTPGLVNTFRPEAQPNIIAGRTNVPSSPIIINEVGNNTTSKYDWIELRNVSAGEINLRNYMISRVTSNSSDSPLIQFPADDKAKVAAGGVFLILASDPADDPNHPIATGYNVNVSAEEQAPGRRNSPARYRVLNFALSNDNFVLIVRRPDGPQGQRSGGHGSQGVAETGNADLDKIVDIAGYDTDLARSAYPNAVSSTELWPLHAFKGAAFSNNKFVEGKVHQRNRQHTNDGRSGAGAQNNNNGLTAFGDRGWTGIGYRRDAIANAENGGTPGYPNGALQSHSDPIVAAVYISEIMYADAANGTLPQWIELRNTSKTEGADLHNWLLTITNHDSTDGADGLWGGKATARIHLRNMKIKPNSSVLITSRKGPRSDVHVPASDIFILYPTHRSTFGMTAPGDDVINTYGFKITLHANAGNLGAPQHWKLVDQASNLSTATDRRGNRERFDAVRWMWPMANTEDGDRISVTRTNSKFDHGDSTMANPKSKMMSLSDGTKKNSWKLSTMDMRTANIDFTYYGHKDDISTPGQTLRLALPVNLSFFRPTLIDGQVVIHWTTESELDNAGFNIYRSESRFGEFKQVNDKLIQGKGTTAERSTYKWVDTSAKPGVEYYYQIEDVSFAGERQMLRTTKMKGLISAKDKLTIQWGELKEVQ